ncbi:MAG: sigma factor, partial [Bacilli bacterium]|nr:sigma factor [Bacilli bacterium]
KRQEDIDDLISIGTIGLIKGIDTFSKKHETRITTYCARCIENVILTSRIYVWHFKTLLAI